MALIGAIFAPAPPTLAASLPNQGQNPSVDEPETGPSDRAAEKNWAEQPSPPDRKTQTTTLGANVQVVPEGHTGDGFTTFVLIVNTGDPVSVDVTFLTNAGPQAPTSVQNIVLQSFERRTINVNAILGPGFDVATKVESEGGDVVVEGSMHFAGSRANSHLIAAPAASSQWFHPEGATHSGFQTFITVANPDQGQTTTVRLTYFAGGTEISGPLISIPPGSRKTANVEATCGCAADVATMVEVVGSNPDVVSAVAVHKLGAFDLGMGASLGVTATADTWVVPEGAAHSGWTTFITIANPNATTSTVNVQYMLFNEVVNAGHKTIPARSRWTLDVVIDCGQVNPNIANPCQGQDIATIIDVVTGSVVAVEGTIQKQDRTGFVIGDSIGSSGSNVTSTTSDAWVAAEGTVHSGFTTFILLTNPLNKSVEVQLTIFDRHGESVAGGSVGTVVLNPKSRRTMDIRDICFSAHFIGSPKCSDDLWTFARSENGSFVMEMSIDWAEPGVGFSKARSLSARHAP